MKGPEMQLIGGWIAEILSHVGDSPVEQKVRHQVADVAARFPIYESRLRGAAAHSRV
jgi:glycine/serine hydroxymethyltransferase